MLGRLNNMQNPFNRVKLEQVFTPSSIAKLTYVNRKTLEDDLEKFIETPGMQIVLYGHSGCGKSTLILNKLEKLNLKSVKTSCESRTTLNDIIAQAFDSLNVFYENERTGKFTTSTSAKLSTEYKSIKSELSGSYSEEKGTKHSRILPIQLTAQRLAEFMGAAGCLWIIEDFHKVAESEKKKIADVLKVFMDASFHSPLVKIVCIGAVGTARELVELESNLSSRVAEIFVPLLNNQELIQIPKTGFKLLNLECPDAVIQKIAHYSNQLASVCHQICFDICHSRKIKKSKFFRLCIEESDFANSVHSYVRKNSDTMAKIYDKCTSCDKRKKAISSIIKTEKDEFSLSELTTSRSAGSGLRWDVLLSELTSIEYHEVLRFDPNSQKYSFSSPFFLAFSKMKMAIERQERIEKIQKSSKRSNLNLMPQNPVLSEDALLSQVINELDGIYKKRLEALEHIYQIQMAQRVKSEKERRR